MNTRLGMASLGLALFAFCSAGVGCDGTVLVYERAAEQEQDDASGAQAPDETCFEVCAQKYGCQEWEECPEECWTECVENPCSEGEPEMWACSQWDDTAFESCHMAYSPINGFWTCCELYACVP